MAPEADDASPFLRYRRHLDSYAAARRAGWGDDRWVDEVRRLDDRVAELDGTGFAVTPLVRLDQLADGLQETAGAGAVWAKVETANVSGSHKARHLFGLALSILVDGGPGQRELAIASCGNAALAAATVAAAAGWPLRVFVPAGADPTVLARLDDLGARTARSARRAGEVGDPCIRDLHTAIDGGAIPFSVQGTLCPGAFDGGRTLGLELAEQLPGTGSGTADLFIQVGGGALAVATMEGLERGGAELPRFHPVQARSAHPFVAAWERLATWRRGRDDARDPLADATELGPLMEPWPVEPVSVATGILDDVTHDWLSVASWTLRTGGAPVLADEDTLAGAAALAGRLVVPPPDATGAAGLAGLLEARRRVLVDPSTAGVVLLTGVDRSWERATEHARRPVEVRAPG